MFRFFNNRLLLVSVLYLTTINYLNAQSNTKDFINASIGLGISSADDESNITNDGFYIQGEYIHVISKWFDLRPYIGFITTQRDSDRENPEKFEASTTALLLGGKSRVTIPIPYIAPYIELGLGTSIGTFKTFTKFTDIEKKGIQLHFPFSIGLELGKKHNIDIAFTYYFHNEINQYAGAAAFGISFPINK